MLLMRELGIREVVFEPQLTGPDRTVFRGVKGKADPAGILRLVQSFSGFAESVSGAQGKASTDLSDLDQ